MAIFRLPLCLNRKICFWRLMGSGRNGSFDLIPDLRQWAVLMVEKSIDSRQAQPAELLEPVSPFINRWIKIFNCTTTRYVLEPIAGHGLWNRKEVFGKLEKQSEYNGCIAVLTRATIPLSKLKRFWKNVPFVNAKMNSATGLVKSYGIGEIPFIKQATFSIWENKEAMNHFAYQMQAHKEVIRKTREEKWYREEMFVRFKVLKTEIK